MGAIICSVALLVYELIFLFILHETTSLQSSFSWKWFVVAVLFIVRNNLLQNYFFIFLGQKKGLAFLSLDLPLFGLKSDLRPVNKIRFKDKSCIHLPSLLMNPLSPEKLRINELCQILLFRSKYKEQKKHRSLKLFLAPESFFGTMQGIPNAHDLIKTHLSKDDQLLMGMYLLEEKRQQKPFQAAMFILNQQITWYKKKLLCPVFEEASFINSVDKKNVTLQIDGEKFTCLVCGEFFLKTPPLESLPHICLLLKELHFPKYLQRMFYACVLRYSFFFKKKVLVVDYSGLRKIDFSGTF